MAGLPQAGQSGSILPQGTGIGNTPLPTSANQIVSQGLPTAASTRSNITQATLPPTTPATKPIAPVSTNTPSIGAGNIASTPPSTLPTSAPIAPAAPVDQSAQIAQQQRGLGGGQVSANNQPDTISQLSHDISSGATVDQISQAYPELKGDTGAINQLIYDVQKGATTQQIQQAYPELSQAQDQGMGVGSVAGIAATVGLGGLGAAYLGGNALKAGSKALYGSTLPRSADEAKALQNYKAGLGPKPTTMVDTALDQPFLPRGKQIINNPLNTGLPNLAGGKSKIGVDAKIAANKIFTKTINPIFDQAEKDGTTVKLTDIYDKAITAVDSAKNMDDLVKEGARNAITDIMQEYEKVTGGILGLRDVHNIKSNIQNFTSPKALRGEVSPSDLQNARAILGGSFKDTLHDTIQSKYGVNSAQQYNNYANLKELADMGVKADTTAGKGGLDFTIKGIGNALATPITTALGRMGYKAGDLISALPNALLKMAKNALPDIMKEVPAAMLYPNMQDQLGQVYDNMSSSVQDAITALNSGKSIPEDNPASTFVKNLTDSRAKVHMLTDVYNAMKQQGRPKEVPTALDQIISKISGGGQ